MKSYNQLERTAAKLLEALPVVRNTAKFIYHRINYLIFSEPSSVGFLNPSAKLLEPAAWAHLDNDIVQETSSLFFGYYDKSPWNFDMSKMLLHLIQGHYVDICLYDRSTSRVKKISRSCTWNYQQGCMLQWLPKSEDLVIFNDAHNSQLISKIVDIDGNLQRTLPMPIQVVHPSGSEALSVNYKRLNDVSEYGYSIYATNFNADQDEVSDGIWKLNIHSGESKLIVSLANVKKKSPRSSMVDSNHQINHLVYSPNGNRFVFIHRWTGQQGRFSRLYVANSDGSGLKLLLDNRMVSHYSWRDEDHILTWSRIAQSGDHYYIVNVTTGDWEIVGEGILDAFGDGHPSFSPNGQWIVTDTYPNRARQRQLLLFNVNTNELVELGRFFAPWSFNGAKRCDLHPRWSPDGKLISIDSAHQGKRSSYILDVSKITMPCF